MYACASRVEGRVPEYRWDVPAEREAACELLREHAVNNVALPGPILLKGPAKHWPAVEKWSLDWMARQWPKLWWVAPGVQPIRGRTFGRCRNCTSSVPGKI